MLKQLFPLVHARYAASAHGGLLSDFAAWLVSAGYADYSVRLHVRRLRQVLERASSAPLVPDARISADFLSLAFAALPAQRGFRSTQRTFKRFLEMRGQLFQTPDPDRFATLLDSYRRYLLEVRGLTVSTTVHHIATIRRFLGEALSRSAPLQDLSTQAVETFVCSAGHRVNRQGLRHVVTRLRAFLRFCFEQNVLAERLDFIDTPRVYRDELPPRALPWPLVLGLLRSVDQSSSLGLRDYTILHLMAHYGLRPSEIVTLTLGAIDWRANTLRVRQCKTKTDLLLPLTGQTMHMLRRYLYRGRPSSVRSELFLRATRPIGPLTSYAISDLYDKRARESGLQLHGTSSYCLRHSFAMRLLDRGVGIKVIGDLLGHHALESTCIYLRLQVQALREVALPLPASVVSTGEAVL